MKVNRLLISGSVFVAAWVTAGAALAQSGTNKSNTINPDVSGPGASSGGSKSERTGDSSDVPLPKGSPSAGTVEQGRSGDGSSARSSGQTGQAVNPAPNSSLGGTQTERARESGVPLPQGSPHSGTTDMGRSDRSPSGAMSQRNSGVNVREAQEALKNKGYDPGPVDGRIGARTKEAIRSFQSASNLDATGTLDAQTAQQLGIDHMKSNNNTTVGKDTDQPNLPPATGK